MCANIAAKDSKNYAEFADEAACEQAVGPLIGPCFTKSVAAHDPTLLVSCIDQGLKASGPSAPSAAATCASIKAKDPKNYAEFKDEAACEKAIGPLIAPCFAKSQASHDKTLLVSCIDQGLKARSGG